MGEKKRQKGAFFVKKRPFFTQEKLETEHMAVSVKKKLTFLPDYLPEWIPKGQRKQAKSQEGDRILVGGIAAHKNGGNPLWAFLTSRTPRKTKTEAFWPPFQQLNRKGQTHGICTPPYLVFKKEKCENRGPRCVKSSPPKRHRSSC